MIHFFGFDFFISWCKIYITFNIFKILYISLHNLKMVRYIKIKSNTAQFFTVNKKNQVQ